MYVFFNLKQWEQTVYWYALSISIIRYHAPFVKGIFQKMQCVQQPFSPTAKAPVCNFSADRSFLFIIEQVEQIESKMTLRHS